jgi:hypothetical protein
MALGQALFFLYEGQFKIPVAGTKTMEEHA